MSTLGGEGFGGLRLGMGWADQEDNVRFGGEMLQRWRTGSRD